MPGRKGKEVLQSMGIDEFNADIKARLAADSSASFAGDEHEFCAYCGKPLPKIRRVFCGIGDKMYCRLCFQIYEIVADRSYFVDAQLEYLRQRRRMDWLRPGRD